MRVAGSQHADGQVERYIEVEDVHPELGVITNEPIRAAEARAWAEALLAAADEIDQMAGSDSLARLQAYMVELVDELLRRGVAAEELCRRIGASSLDELRSVVGNDEAWR